MKIRSILSIAPILFLSLTLTAKADVLVATNSMTTSGCSSVVTYQNTYATYTSIVCNGTTALTIIKDNTRNTCSYPSVAAGYSLNVTSNCSFQLYQIAQSTQLPTSCSAITYQQSVAGSAVGGAMTGAISWCKTQKLASGAFCTGATTTSNANGTYNIICQ